MVKRHLGSSGQHVQAERVERPSPSGLGLGPARAPQGKHIPNAKEFNAADEALQGTQVPEVSPRVKANKSAMARLLSR